MSDPLYQLPKPVRKNFKVNHAISAYQISIDVSSFKNVSYGITIDELGNFIEGSSLCMHVKLSSSIGAKLKLFFDSIHP
jgi:hypothetical protein